MVKIKGQKVTCLKCNGELKKEKSGFICGNCNSCFSKQELTIAVLKKGGLDDFKAKQYAHAMKKFMQIAKADDKDGQYYVGVCFDNGHGCKQDHKKAYKWFLKAAKQGHASAQFNLGYCYEMGEGVGKSLKKAVEWYEKAAESNHAKAIEQLREINEEAEAKKTQSKKSAKPAKPTPIKRETDEKETETILQPVVTPTPTPVVKGTPASVSVTMKNSMPTGSILEDIDETTETLETIEVVPVTNVQAQKGVKTAEIAEKPVPAPTLSAPASAQPTQQLAVQKPKITQPTFSGNFNFEPSFPTAQPTPVQPTLTAEDYYYMGLEQLETGKAAEAVKNLETAAKQGYDKAQLALGNCYLNGHGVLPDYGKAVAWLEKACAQNNAKAQYLLGCLYLNGSGVEKNEQKATQLLGQAANQGDALAQLNLANCYVNGTGVPRDLRFACIYYERAAKQGNANAQYYLGYCYYNGWGVDKNWLQAKAWYEKAAAQGQGDAIEKLRDSRWN